AVDDATTLERGTIARRGRRVHVLLLGEIAAAGLPARIAQLVAHADSPARDRELRRAQTVGEGVLRRPRARGALARVVSPEPAAEQATSLPGRRAEPAREDGERAARSRRPRVERADAVVRDGHEAARRGAVRVDHELGPWLAARDAHEREQERAAGARRR